jgi:hypothetical protein
MPSLELGMNIVKHHLYLVYLGIVLLVLFAQSAQPRQAAWTHYRNERWGFCIEYPRNWDHDEGVNKAGIAIFPRQGRAYVRGAQISVGALLAGGSNGRALTVEEGFSEEDNIRREQGEADLIVVEKHSTTVGDQPAAFRKISYKEASSGIAWVEEVVAFNTKDDVRYAFELKSRPSELARLEPVFNDIIKTFQIECPNGARHRAEQK